jgi:hypothetical protein
MEKRQLTATRAHNSRSGVTRVAEPKVVQIDVTTMLLHTGRDYSTAEVSSGRRITEAEALRTRRDMAYAQHQVDRALDRLCKLDRKSPPRRRAQGATLDELARSFNVSLATISRLRAGPHHL